MAFVVDLYNKYDRWDREHSVYKFEINGQWYAIKEVEMDWGLPQVGCRVDQDMHPEHYFVYSKYEDALKYVYMMKQLAR